MLERLGTTEDVVSAEFVVEAMCDFIDLNVLGWPPNTPQSERVLAVPGGSSLAHYMVAIYDDSARICSSDSWLCKSLENADNASALLEVDDDMMFLHMARDGRDSFLSSRRTPIGAKNPYLAGLRWSQEQGVVSSALSGAANKYRVQYDELVQAPDSVLLQLCERIGVRFDAAALNFHQSQTAQHAARRSVLWTNLAKPISSSSVGVHRRPEYRDQIRQFEEAAFDSLVKEGYQPMYASGPVWRTGKEIDTFNAEDRRLRLLATSSAPAHREARHTVQDAYLDMIVEHGGVF